MSQIIENICACWLKSPKRWSLGYEIKLWAPTFMMSNKAFWIITMKCVEYYTNTMRINMQTVTYFWNNTTNQVAFWWSIKRSKMKLSYLVKLLPTSTLPWIKYLWSPIHSKSYYFKKKRNSKHYGQSCWFQYMRYEWYSFTAAKCMLKKYDVST